MVKRKRNKVMKYVLVFLIELGIFCSSTIYGQSGSKMGEVKLLNQERRKALVIGNLRYESMRPLKNTERDADSMTVVLKTLGFEVMTFKNLDYKNMADRFQKFYESLRPGDVVIFYYSGHGIGYDGKNFMLPIDTRVQCINELKVYELLSLNTLLSYIKTKQVKNCFVFLDACRNIGLPESCDSKDGGAVQGLSFPKNNPEGTYIVYATEEGSTADDDSYNKVNSLFTAELIKNLRVSGWSHRKIIDETSKRVKQISNQRQRPEKYENMDDEFFFLLDGERRKQAPPPEPPKQVVQKLQNGSLRKDASYTPTLIYVEGGKFMMGSPSPTGSDIERPIHQVSLDAFWIGQYEVTVTEYMTFVNETNLHFPEWLDKNSGYHINLDDGNYYASRGLRSSRSDLPIVGIGWNDAQAYCDWLSKKTNRKYRLPTEAEWEYAANGGNTPKDYVYAGSNDFNEVGWVGANSNNQLHIVGSKKSNSLGLYDMSGNAWEWCADWYAPYTNSSQHNPLNSLGDKKFKVVRGGSFGYTQDNARTTFRTPVTPTTRFEFTGFRVVCEIEK
jgi:formylglycine-generating enzyme required for sulfatase activity